MSRGGLAALVLLLVARRAAAQDFATQVLEFAPAPGQLVNAAAYNDPARALGPPAGGGPSAADNTKLVTLGGFGGSITLGFAAPVRDDARNPLGMDLIVFGNAFYVGGAPWRRFAECATIEVSRDDNANGLPDDPWYVIPGSHLGPVPAAHQHTQTWDSNAADPTFPPASPLWIPAGQSGTWTTSGYLLSGPAFVTWPVLENAGGPDAAAESLWGCADLSPVLALGDTDANGAVDDPGLDPGAFYTRPDDPHAVGLTPGSGGGDAVDLAAAVDPATGAPAGLQEAHFVRLRTALHVVHPLLGEASTEVGGVARVRPVLRADFSGDGAVTTADITAFLSAWFGDVTTGGTGTDFDADGAVDAGDVSAFLVVWFQEAG
ncbi:MAG TPA: hypothetical protein VD963_00050 [Phycisphaerales bacterium]|nr:hypothetical protein [Phycisphaerales bacterium]